MGCNGHELENATRTTPQTEESAITGVERTGTHGFRYRSSLRWGHQGSGDGIGDADQQGVRDDESGEYKAGLFQQDRV